MAPNFSKNAILKGGVPSDFFCLVCEIYFTSSVKCADHIYGADHRKNMNVIEYLEEFKEDGIIKIKNQYFCELCNRLLTAFVRITMHIKEPSHIENRNTSFLKRINNVITAFDSIMIDDTAWHGQCNNTCAICNKDCLDIEYHKKLPSHLLNLIQSKVEYDKNKNIYRKIDDSFIQCLTCNLHLGVNTNHFESDCHKLMYKIACDNYKTMKQEIIHASNLISIKNDDNDNSDYINYEEKKCTLCNWPVNISQIEEHNNGIYHQTNLNSHKQRMADKDELSNANKRNRKSSGSNKFKNDFIKMNFGTREVFCTKCSIPLESNHELIIKHIADHQTQFQNEQKPIQVNYDEKKSVASSAPKSYQPLEVNGSKSSKVAETIKDANAAVMDVVSPLSPKIKKTNEKTLEKLPTKDFIESIVGIKSFIFKDLVINNKICLNIMSFCFLTFPKDKTNMKCFVCDENVLFKNFESHTDSPKHEQAMRNSLVLIKYDTEFIREVKSGHFHCGHCNICLSSWSDMEGHLKSSSHIESKNDSFWRLKQYQPEISKKDMSLKTMVDTVFAYMFTVKFL